MTGRSRSSRPWSTSSSAAVPVNVFVIEPVWNRVPGVTGSGFSMLVMPNASCRSSPSSSTPIATPGTPSSSCFARTASNTPTRGNLPRAHEPLDGVHQLIDLLLPAFADAVADVILHHADRDAVERRPRRRHLGQDVDAVPLVLDHRLKPAHLPFDALQALEERLLVPAADIAVLHAWASGSWSKVCLQWPP